MNTKNIFKNIQEKIALEKFKIETKRKRNTQRTLIVISAIALVFTSWIMINKTKESNN